MLDIILIIAEIAGCITAVAAAITVFVKPIREKIFNNRRSVQGELCLLRTEILKIYYKGLEKKEIRQFEMENLVQLYEAYSALGGNSFVQLIFEEMVTWRVIQ